MYHPVWFVAKVSVVQGGTRHTRWGCLQAAHHLSTTRQGTALQIWKSSKPYFASE
jgi:hypothetical protein